MKKIILAVLLVVGISGCTKSEESTNYIASLSHLTFEELDEKIALHEEFVVYFGWVEGCGDATNFQDNYVAEQAKEYPAFNDIYVVDLDIELPEGLLDKTKRQPMEEAYGARYSPTVIHYVGGEVEHFIEWTPATTDATYGMFKADLDAFFTEIGYIK